MIIGQLKRTSKTTFFADGELVGKFVHIHELFQCSYANVAYRWFWRNSINIWPLVYWLIYCLYCGLHMAGVYHTYGSTLYSYWMLYDCAIVQSPYYFIFIYIYIYNPGFFLIYTANHSRNKRFEELTPYVKSCFFVKTVAKNRNRHCPKIFVVLTWASRINFVLAVFLARSPAFVAI